jgi:S1-C subfamily serine protease
MSTKQATSSPRKLSNNSRNINSLSNKAKKHNVADKNAGIQHKAKNKLTAAAATIPAESESEYLLKSGLLQSVHYTIARIINAGFHLNKDKPADTANTAFIDNSHFNPISSAHDYAAAAIEEFSQNWDYQHATILAKQFKLNNNDSVKLNVSAALNEIMIEAQGHSIVTRALLKHTAPSYHKDNDNSNPTTLTKQTQRKAQPSSDAAAASLVNLPKLNFSTGYMQSEPANYLSPKSSQSLNIINHGNAVNVDQLHGLASPRKVLAKLKEDKAMTKQYIATLTPFLGFTLDDSPTLRVNSVVFGSAAQKAGLQIEDLLLSIDHQRLTSRNQFDSLVNAMQIGNLINFKISRNSKYDNVSFMITAHNWTTEEIKQLIKLAHNETTAPSHTAAAPDAFSPQAIEVTASIHKVKTQPQVPTSDPISPINNVRNKPPSNSLDSNLLSPRIRRDKAAAAASANTTNTIRSRDVSPAASVITQSASKTARSASNSAGLALSARRASVSDEYTIVLTPHRVGVSEVKSAEHGKLSLLRSPARSRRESRGGEGFNSPNASMDPSVDEANKQLLDSQRLARLQFEYSESDSALQRLKRAKKYFGLEIADSNSGTNETVKVIEVKLNLPADEAGILVNDEILSINGLTTPNRTTFHKVVQSFTVGDEVVLIVRRNKKQLMNILIRLGAKDLDLAEAQRLVQLASNHALLQQQLNEFSTQKSEEKQEKIIIKEVKLMEEKVAQFNDKIEVTIQKLSVTKLNQNLQEQWDKLKVWFGCEIADVPRENRVKVFKLLRNKPAHLAGIMENDQILAVNGQKVANRVEFFKAIKPIMPLDEVNLLIQRPNEAKSPRKGANNKAHILTHEIIVQVGAIGMELEEVRELQRELIKQQKKAAFVQQLEEKQVQIEAEMKAEKVRKLNQLSSSIARQPLIEEPNEAELSPPNHNNQLIPITENNTPDKTTENARNGYVYDGTIGTKES